LLAKYLRMTTVKRNTQEPRKIKHEKIIQTFLKTFFFCFFFCFCKTLQKLFLNFSQNANKFSFGEPVKTICSIIPSNIFFLIYFLLYLDKKLLFWGNLTDFYDRLEVVFSFMFYRMDSKNVANFKSLPIQ
jgi:hypothetical protein